MLGEEQERHAMRGFDYVMQSFKIMQLNKSDKGARMLDNTSLRAAVQRYEKIRLEVMLRFSKYSIKELKSLFTAIDVEAEATNILAKWDKQSVAA